jgi:hypothetical protein
VKRLVAEFQLVINVLSEVNLRSMARAVKHIDAVLLPTGLGMLFFILFTVNHYDTTQIISSNILLST